MKARLLLLCWLVISLFLVGIEMMLPGSNATWAAQLTLTPPSDFTPVASETSTLAPTPASTSLPPSPTPTDTSTAEGTLTATSTPTATPLPTLPATETPAGLIPASSLTVTPPPMRDGTSTAEPIGTPGPKPTPPPRQIAANPLEVFISEVAWAGTEASTADEWIELKNNTSNPIALTGWTLVAADGTPNIALAGTIPADGYFLLERTDDNTVSDIPADQIYTGALGNAGESLTLRDESLNVVDTANADGGGWPGGTTGTSSPPYASMERLDPTTADSDANWGTNDSLTCNGLDADGNPVNGTPKAANSASTPMLTPTPSPTSTPTATSTLTPTPSPTLAPLSVVISEVAWAGTEASTADEWIELKNNTSSPIALTGWTLVAADGTPNIALAGTIPADGYFLLERTDDNTVSDIPADQIYTGALGNAGESLTLRDESLNVIDTANADGGGWPGGTTGTGSPPYTSMERLDPTVADSDANWHANNGLTRNGLDADGNPVNGTPKAANSAPTPTPTPTATSTSTPTPTPSPTLAPLSVVISEVAWAGTEASTADEWIELKNNTSNPIALTGWTLVAADGTPNIALAGTIPADGYFLLERTDDNTISDIPADQIYTGALGNAGESLTLRDEGLNVIDTANADGGGWPGGTTGAGSPPYASMERLDPTVADSDANWHANNGLTRNGLDADGNPINGTPKAVNSAPAPMPTPTPSPTSTPTPTPSPTLAPLSVVISEVAWAGTEASTADEWIELKNNTSNPIALTGWTLVAADGTPNIALNGTLPAHGYFLLERTDDNTVSDIPADQIYTGALGNAGESLTLRDEGLNVIDTANADGGGWPGGTTGTGSPPYASMERLDPAAADTDANWGTNDGLTRNGLDADDNPLNGTPKAANSAPAPVPPLAIVISEVVYDGITPSTEGDEFVEIYNPLTITARLGDYKVGDEETQGGGEGMYRFPPATVITPGTCLVVARNAAQFQARFGFYPDFEMRTSGSGYTDTPSVPDMTRYTAWGTGSWALANDGDEVLLLGPSDEIVDAVAFRNGAYVTVGVTGTVSAPEPKSFQRVEDWDSDDMQADFVIDQPDPGYPLLVPEPPSPPPPPAPLPGGMQGYFGCLHSHSTYSDGSGPPRYAFAVARANGMHFLALTDHSHRFNDLQWADILTQAQAAIVDGAFVGLRGFEWTSREQGHSDVFATHIYVSREDPPYDTLAGFYAWLTTQPEVIAQFNHPFGPPYDTGFDNFAYDAAAAQKMALLEVGNGSGEEYRTFEEAYLHALAIGWRVGATNNGDTEAPDWGLDTPHRTGIVAPALTRGDLLAALRARRTFATEDANLALALRSGDQWMGSTISPTATIAFSVDFYDPDGEAITLELFNRSILVATTSVSGVISDTWTVTVPGAAGHFYFARATQADGDRAYTSPLWTEGTAVPEPIAINEVLPEPQYEDWNGDGLIDSDDEWIELYNPGEWAVDLGGWQLDDVGDGGSWPYVIPFGTVIQPKGFLVFFKRETGIALNDDGDWVRLLYLDGSEADVFHYTQSPGDDRSWSRVVDGIGGWTEFFDVTPGEPNRPPPLEPTPTPFPLLTIAEARRQPSGITVTVRGQVTVPPPLFSEETLYIQDSTAGIMVYITKNDYLPLAEGGWVVLRGEAYDYHGEREIRIYRDGDLLLHQGAGEPLKPTVLETGQVDEDHEGLLAMIAGRVVGYEWQAIHLDDGTGPVRVYIREGTDIEKPWVEEGQTFSIIGIVSQYVEEKPYEGGYRLLPRYPSDLLQLPLYLPETGTLR